jgi:hypothetical protein
MGLTQVAHPAGNYQTGPRFFCHWSMRSTNPRAEVQETMALPQAKPVLARPFTLRMR